MKSESYWKPYWKINAVLCKGVQVTKKHYLPKGTDIVIDAFKATWNFRTVIDGVLKIHVISPCSVWIPASAVKAKGHTNLVSLL